MVKGDTEETLKKKKMKKELKEFTYAEGEAGILLDLPIEDNIGLSSYYETLFYILFSHYKEPLLLCGPSGYKSKLAKDILPGARVINLYPEISNSQLIGNVTLLVNYQTKEYYLEQICKICKKEEELKDLKDDLKGYYEEKKKEAMQIKEKKIKKENIQQKQKKKEIDKNKKKENSHGSIDFEIKDKKKKNNQKLKKHESESEDSLISISDDPEEKVENNSNNKKN